MRPIMPNIEAPVPVIEADRDQMRRGLLSTGGWSVAMVTENVASLPDTDAALQMLARHRTAAQAREAILGHAVANILPIGDDRAPGDRVIPIYVRMDELRVLRELAALSAGGAA